MSRSLAWLVRHGRTAHPAWWRCTYPVPSGGSECSSSRYEGAEAAGRAGAARIGKGTCFQPSDALLILRTIAAALAASRDSTRAVPDTARQALRPVLPAELIGVLEDLLDRESRRPTRPGELADQVTDPATAITMYALGRFLTESSSNTGQLFLADLGESLLLPMQLIRTIDERLDARPEPAPGPMPFARHQAARC